MTTATETPPAADGAPPRGTAPAEAAAETEDEHKRKKKGRPDAGRPPGDPIGDKIAAWARQGQNWIVAAIVVGGIAGALAYSAAESFGTEVGAAVSHHLAFPHLYPLSLEGILVSLLVFDARTTAKDEPMWPLRLAVRIFNAAIIAINAQAGWPSPFGTVMHAIPPSAFAFSVEIGLYWILRRKHADERARKKARRRQRKKERADARIPVARWFLEPVQTAAIARLLITKEAATYKSARELHRRRRVAFEVARRRYPQHGMHDPAVPADLAWRLERGIDLTNALRDWKNLLGTEDRIASLEREHAARVSALMTDLDALTEALTAERALTDSRSLEAERALTEERERSTEALTRAAELERQVTRLSARRRPRHRSHGDQQPGAQAAGERSASTVERSPGAAGNGGEAPAGALSKRQQAFDLMEREPALRETGMAAEVARRVGAPESSARRWRSEFAGLATATSVGGPLTGEQ